MKIHVIDNGGQWTHREWRVLRYLEVESEIIPNDLPFDKIKKMNVDGLVLSGGAPRIVEEFTKLGNISEYLDKADFPILGICVGHQFMVMHFGGKVGPADVPEFGRMEIIVDDENDLFKGVPKKFVAWESHNDEVQNLPNDFISLAHSENCKIQAVKYKKKPYYGVQFHPEVEHTEHGYDIFKNFIEICKKNKK
jgi:GMP synthase (glutamine-hydrolysing)